VYATPAGGSPFAKREIIYRSSPTGGSPVQLAIGADPAISPDGRWVAYHDGTVGAPGVLQLISTTGGFPTSFAATTGEPVAWSADSQMLAATDSRGVAIIEVRSHKTNVIALPASSSQFSFSPDGSALVFQRSTFHGIYVYTVSTNGGAPHRLTSDGRSGSPLWGRDGIAFWRDAHHRACPSCFGDVWMMSGNGSDAHQITHTGAGIMPIAWSADGSHLLAAVPARHNGKLYAVDLAKGRTYALTELVGDLFAQGLSRDGQTVLAAIGCGGMPTLTGLVETIPFKGGEPTVIVRGPCRASWNA
jgi:Tol biopolymer transport system component